MENAGRAIVLPFKGKVKRNRRFRTGLIKHHLCFNLDEEQVMVDSYADLQPQSNDIIITSFL